jgi:hypothetical protein
MIALCRLVFEIIGMFCPTYYPDRDIVLLEQCDKPSLFQVRPAGRVLHAKQRCWVSSMLWTRTQLARLRLCRWAVVR